MPRIASESQEHSHWVSTHSATGAVQVPVAESWDYCESAGNSSRSTPFFYNRGWKVTVEKQWHLPLLNMQYNSSER